MRKCRCGNNVSRNAKSCPQCGHRFTGGFTKFVGWCILILVVTGVVGSMLGSGTNVASNPAPASTPTPTPAQQKDDINFKRAAVVAQKLRSNMRNPDSFKLTEVLIMPSGAVCYSYRSQNGFGGMNQEQAVLSSKDRLTMSESDGFETAWNRECAHKTGEDKTWEVGYAAGFHGVLDR